MFIIIIPILDLEFVKILIIIQEVLFMLLMIKICKVSSVGYTADNLKTSFTNHKIHIMFNKRFCEFSKHFADNINFHHLDKSSQNKYDNCLKQQIEVINVEQVDLTGVGSSIESIRLNLKEREWFWQNNLKTTRQFGRLNVREEH